jgi:hypothetical protein
MTRKMAAIVVSVWIFLLIGQAFGASGKTVGQLLDQYGPGTNGNRTDFSA